MDIQVVRDLGEAVVEVDALEVHQDIVWRMGLTRKSAVMSATVEMMSLEGGKAKLSSPVQVEATWCVE